jgi:hypothetical protein
MNETDAPQNLDLDIPEDESIALDPEHVYEIDGEKVTGRDLLNQRMMHADYTRKTQEIAEVRSFLETWSENMNSDEGRALNREWLESHFIQSGTSDVDSPESSAQILLPELKEVQSVVPGATAEILKEAMAYYPQLATNPLAAVLAYLNASQRGMGAAPPATAQGTHAPRTNSDDPTYSAMDALREAQRMIPGF